MSVEYTPPKIPRKFQEGHPVTPEMEEDSKDRAHQLVMGALERAVKVKIDNLESADLKIRDAAATFIIERALGKPKQHIEVEDDGSHMAATLFGALMKASNMTREDYEAELRGYRDEEGTYVIDQEVNRAEEGGRPQLGDGSVRE